jgi:hypothetical protein
VPSGADILLARMGKTRQDFAKQSALGKVFRREGVPHSKELERVLGLPRRVWQSEYLDGPELAGIGADLQELYGTEGCELPLWPVQIVAIVELHNYGGLFGPIKVGGGKTLLTHLAPVVVGAERPLLLIPAKLKGKTAREFKALARHWQGHPALEIMSYELLSRDRGGQELERIRPDLIIADEAHKLKNLRAGCTRKIRRHMQAYPETRFVAVSGTITTRSLREYHHLITWALPRAMPLPRPWGELQDWADALDEKVDEQRRLAPGALLQLCDKGELAVAQAGQVAPITAARRAFRRRLVETPGVVATEEAALGCSLQIEELRVPTSEAAHEAFMHLRLEWETPDGHPVCEAIEIWRHAREIACGFYYKWDPPAPPTWLGARREWAAFVRETIKHTRRALDTEFQVARACARGELDATAYQAWVDIRDGFKPHTVPVWIDDNMLAAAEGWLSVQREPPGLCWVEHRAFGQRLSERTGIPYFSNEGRDATGHFIEDWEGPAILSIASNSEGRNLQHKWHRNLVVSAPPKGAVWEQLLGRTHREGQEADEVTCEVALACGEQWAAFQQSVADAHYIQDTMGTEQKLCFADVCMPDPSEVNARGLEDAAWWIG